MSKGTVSISSVLSRQEAEECKAAFDRYDTGKTGFVNLSELRKLLNEIGQLPNDDELFDLILQLNLDTSGTISFASYIELIELHKKKIHGALDDQGTLDAFVVCGGNRDKTGTVSTKKVSKIIHEYELTIDIDTILQELDSTQSGYIDFYKFSSIFSKVPSQRGIRHAQQAAAATQALSAMKATLSRSRTASKLPTKSSKVIRK
ncbi:dynein light chain [Monocercomonoides exilis]|uniref:dynein light chain n=1 Tax=Monocercomonoides exilis TaxID=2049356 RepID=UPI003559B260|nr:dynein light chain [Monocercomonoides exilis]|eukprot:MONOS_5975.1-p1 / transcript=MONOS_5975.1 / gene=MONOS_5975 / organism=Monocercomonoides_exilis_PA203 / gene_product=dynein light chain / transcript_product=dynein light chain / location=Mono_scaffold00181:80855-81622(-) / protein_length=203 / sequence_SO=supercontig / SO=protein_coding / is_pseudo=false